MYDIHHLEEEWKRYNRKKKRPWIIALVIFLIVSIGGVFLLKNSNIFFGSFKRKIYLSRTEHNLTKTVSPVYVDVPLNQLQRKDSNDILVDTSVNHERSLEENKTPMISENKMKKNKIHIEVVDADSKTVYKEIEKRFRLGHNSDDSLFLAKAYYLKGQYKKAEYWALQTNKINENIDESWLIFIKSKIKRGHKNEAIQILNRYIEKTDSREAKVLLKKIMHE